MSATKRCSGCKQFKSLSDFHRSKNKKYGRGDYCKPCSKLVWQRWYDKKYPRLKRRREEYKALYSERKKRCTNCGEIKSLSEFYNRKDCRDGHGSWCKQCEQIADKKHKQSKEWRAWYKKYIKTVRGQAVRGRSVERYAQTEKHRIACAKRTSRKKGLISDLTDEDWLFILDFFDGQCAYCKAAPKKLEQDHVIPVTQGGGYTFNNIVPACLPCNRSKNNRDVKAWMNQQKYNWGWFESKWKSIQQMVAGG